MDERNTDASMYVEKSVTDMLIPFLHTQKRINKLTCLKNRWLDKTMAATATTKPTAATAVIIALLQRRFTGGSTHFEKKKKQSERVIIVCLMFIVSSSVLWFLLTSHLNFSVLYNKYIL